MGFRREDANTNFRPFETSTIKKTCLGSLFLGEKGRSVADLEEKGLDYVRASAVSAGSHHQFERKSKVLSGF